VNDLVLVRERRRWGEDDELKRKQGFNRSLKMIGVKQAASLNFLTDCQFILAEIEISFRLKKEIIMTENERGGKMNWKRMGMT
jgi:hypothetical protein